MLEIEKITEAIIGIEDGVINIAFGNINKNHDNFHDRVSIKISPDGSIIFAEGHKLKYKTIYDSMNEYDDNFDKYRQELVGFEERIELSKSFSWYRNLNIENFKDSWDKLWFKKFKIVYSSCFGTKYIYKTELWSPKEYRANNWVITEHK